MKTLVPTTIWKFVLDPANLTIYPPKGACFLSVGEQKGDIVIWAMINPKETKEENRTIEVFGTGQTIPPAEKRMFIGTVQMDSGLVFHVFELIAKAN